MVDMSTNRAAALPAAAASVPGRPDRRARRRQQTIEEILAIAADLMTEEGVNGLSLAGIRLWETADCMVELTAS